jgi:hypothetical protein
MPVVRRGGAFAYVGVCPLVRLRLNFRHREVLNVER